MARKANTVHVVRIEDHPGLDEDTRASLVAFKARNGKNWKAALQGLWLRAAVGLYGAELHILRNTQANILAEVE